MDTITYNDNEKYTKGKICLDKLVSEHDKQINKELIEKATEWLKANADKYIWYNTNEFDCGMIDEFIRDFKKDMEG